MKDKFKDTKGLDKAYMSLAEHYDERKENAIRQVKDGAFVDLLNNEIEELQKAKAIEEIAKEICSHCLEMTEEKVCPYANTEDEAGNEACFTERLHEAEKVYNAGYRKLPKDSVVLSREELKRLETNYKIGLGKSQSWCKSLKNRIEELEKENFKLKIDNEVLKEEKEQFENDVCNYEMNLQHLIGELENKSKETAEKILKEIWHNKFETIITIKNSCSKEDIENVGKEILISIRNKLKEIATREGVEIKE